MPELKHNFQIRVQGKVIQTTLENIILKRIKNTAIPNPDSDFCFISCP